MFKSALPVFIVAAMHLSGCGGLKEAFMGRENELAPLADARLGLTHRGEILQKFGAPDEIDQRRFDGTTREVSYYFDDDPGDDGDPRLRILACEFGRDALTGYVFQEIPRSAGEGFDEGARRKLAIGKTARREAGEILGAPDGRALLPTTLNLNALSGRIGGIPMPVTKIPDSAREVWVYQVESFAAGPEQPNQQTLLVFFDDQGLYAGSVALQQIVGQLP